MTDTVRDELGQFAPAPVIEPTYAERADAAIAKVFPELAAKEAPPEPAKTTTEDVASTATKPVVETEKPKRTPVHEKAVKTLEVFGMKPETAAKLSEQEALELAMHRNQVDVEYKAKVTRLNELEALHKAAPKTESQASTAAAQHPVSTGQGQSFVDVAKPVAEKLGLSEDELPILAGAFEAVARIAAEANKADLADFKAWKESQTQQTEHDATQSAIEGLVGLYPELKDEARAPAIVKRVESLAMTPYYADASPTYQGRVAAVWKDAMRLEFGDRTPETVKPSRPAARSNGQLLTESATSSKPALTRDQQVMDNALRAARTVGP